MSASVSPLEIGYADRGLDLKPVEVNLELSLSEYVQWLYRIENVKLWEAKKKAQTKYFKQTGKLVPLYLIQSIDEIEEQKQIDKLSIGNKRRAIKTREIRQSF